MDPLLQFAPTATHWNEREIAASSDRLLGFALTAGASRCFGRSVSER